MSTLLAVLRKLEVELHVPEVRSDASRLHELLHPDFTEFGRSGRTYSFSQVVAALQAETKPARVHAQDFAVRRLTESLALLTYKSADIKDGKLERHTLRSSLWQLGPAGWQMLFHQGTPTEAFAQNAAEPVDRADV